jgi:hypothetical protein
MYNLGEEMPEVHEWCVDKTASLCDKIDALGGWNPRAVSVKFFHGDKRTLVFSDNYYNSGYWTVCLTKDEYYWHRISEKRKKEFEDEIRTKIRNRI